METTISIIVILVCVPLSFFFSAVFYPLYALLRKIFYVPLVRNKMLKKAVKEGRVIIAHKARDGENGQDAMAGMQVYRYENGRNRGVYLFEARGRVHKRLVSSQWDLPDTLTLFYQKNPCKAQMENVFGFAENPTWFLQYLVLVVIGIIILYMVGMEYVQGYVQNLL